MSRWIVALRLLAVAVAISGGDLASAGSLVEALGNALSPAQTPVGVSARGQNPGPQRGHQRHRLVRRSKPQAPDPLTAVLDKARPSELASTRTVTTGTDEAILKPHSVSTISTLAPPARADTTTEIIALPPDDVPKMPSTGSALSRSSGPSAAIKLILLLIICAGTAMGIYGLVAFDYANRAAGQRLSRTR